MLMCQRHVLTRNTYVQFKCHLMMTMRSMYVIESFYLWNTIPLLNIVFSFIEIHLGLLRKRVPCVSFYTICCTYDPIEQFQLKSVLHTKFGCTWAMEKVTNLHFMGKASKIPFQISNVNDGLCRMNTHSSRNIRRTFWTHSECNANEFCS